MLTKLKVCVLILAISGMICVEETKKVLTIAAVTGEKNSAKESVNKAQPIIPKLEVIVDKFKNKPELNTKFHKTEQRLRSHLSSPRRCLDNFDCRRYGFRNLYCSRRHFCVPKGYGFAK